MRREQRPRRHLESGRRDRLRSRCLWRPSRGSRLPAAPPRADALDASRRQSSHGWPVFLARRPPLRVLGGRAAQRERGHDRRRSTWVARRQGLHSSDAGRQRRTVRPAGVPAVPARPELDGAAVRGRADWRYSGEAFPIAEQVANPQKFRHGCFTVSGNGTLAYLTGDIGLMQAVWVDGNGRRPGPSANPGGSRGPGCRPTGSGWPSRRRKRTRRTSTSGSSTSPAASAVSSRSARRCTSPDLVSRRLAHRLHVQQPGSPRPVRQERERSGDAEPLLVSDAAEYPTDWSPTVGSSP